MSNSTEMVTRVARAIWAERVRHAKEAHGFDLEDYNQTIGFGPASEQFPSVAEHNNIMGEARAAIEAMREPTEAMEFDGGIKAENMLFGGDPDYTGVIFTDMGFVYRAMIDQALSPDPALSPEDEGRERK